MKYKIVEGSDPTVVMHEVNNLLYSGFKLQGGVSVTHAGAGHTWYAQALTYELVVVDGPGDQT